MIEEAREILEEGVICDHCLGRRYALRSWGLSNRERGRALRIVVAMEDDVDFDVPAEEDCWVCGGVFSEIDDWVEKVLEVAMDVEFGSFHVGTRPPPLVEENEAYLDETHGEEYSESFKSEFNREVGKRVEEGLDAVVDLERPDVVFVLNLQRGDVDLQVNPLFIYGRYRKLERGIPQTEWPCRECGGSGCGNCDGTGYLYGESVEELVRPAVLDASEGSKMVFHGAGREDVDALMLGDGRPFVAEVKEPRRREFDLRELTDAVNSEAGGKVEVRNLCFVKGGMVERVKEVDANKRYRLKVDAEGEVGQQELDEALEGLEGVVEQRTPERVSHRRADRVRERRVHDAKVDVLDGGFEVEVFCEGGLYVKELVTGDGGRTQPSLAGLLDTRLEVLELDVLAVEGSFLEEVD